MTLQITMRIFSGRRDPTWTVDGAEEQELRRMLASSVVETARPIIPYHLGYRGFTIVDPAAPGQPLVRVRSLGRADMNQSFCNAPEIENFLLRTGREHIPFWVEGVVVESMDVEPRLVQPHIACPPSLAPAAPAYEPNLWQGTEFGYDIEAYNNCYNYATNRRIGHRADSWGDALPGRASGDAPDVIGRSCAGYLRAAVSDGLVLRRTFKEARLLGEGHYVVLVMWPGVDHHWYRQDNTGCWSHKIGGTPVTNLDNAGREIADPQVCDRGGYTLFVAYMSCPPGATIA